MTLHIFQDQNYRCRRTKTCYVRYNARHGQIHVSAGILDLFGIPYGDPVFVQFAQDCNTREWYFTLASQKRIGYYKLQYDQKKSGRLFALVCHRRTLARQMAEALGAESMKCPKARNPTWLDDQQWHKIVTTVNLLSTKK